MELDGEVAELLLQCGNQELGVLGEELDEGFVEERCHGFGVDVSPKLPVCNWEDSTTPGQPVGHQRRRGVCAPPDSVFPASIFSRSATDS
jgi:hypothetical protein